MSYHDSITTKEQDNLDIDASTNFAEEQLLEQDQTHQEKFTTATPNEESEHRSALSSQQSLPNSMSNCTLHPEEILQFYCFDDNTLLCAECLVKGKYGGMDIANLRRAAEKLKGKLGELARESTSKIEDCGVLGKDIETQQNQIKEVFSSYKEDIKEKMNALRQAIDQREQEIFNKIEGIQNEKLTVINTTESSLRSYREGMELLRSTVQYKLSELDDISICRFYMTKADAFKENLNDEVCNRVQRVKKMVDRHQVQDQVSFFKLRDEWMKAQAAINEIGNGISNTTKSESPSLRDAEIGGSQRMLSADNVASYTSKERTNPERRVMYKESVKSQALKNALKDENSRQRQTPSFISVSNSGGIRSPVGSPRQTSARGPLMVEIRRGDLSQTDMGSGSTLNRRNSPSNINRYKSPLSIKTDTYEPLYSPKGSPRPTNLVYGSTTSFLSTSPRYTANFNNSIVATQSPKYTSPSRKATLEASLSQLGTYNTITETGQTNTKERLLSPERLAALKNESFNGLEEYVNHKKGKGQGQGVQSPSGASNLKSKLKELNAQIFK